VLRSRSTESSVEPLSTTMIPHCAYVEDQTDSRHSSVSCGLFQFTTITATVGWDTILRLDENTNPTESEGSSARSRQSDDIILHSSQAVVSVRISSVK
jgi:hypothetical protein